jgi:hypothetical protein
MHTCCLPTHLLHLLVYPQAVQRHTCFVLQSQDRCCRARSSLNGPSVDAAAGQPVHQSQPVKHYPVLTSQTSLTLATSCCLGRSILGSLLKSPLPSDASMYPRTPSSVVVLWEEITSDSSLEHQASIAETAAATARAGSIGVDRQRGVSEGAAAAPSRAVPAAQQQQQQQQQQGGAEIDEEGQLDDGELPQQQGEGQTQGAGEAAGVQGGAGEGGVSEGSDQQGCMRCGWVHWY